jgi:hypothetical protein
VTTGISGDTPLDREHDSHGKPIDISTLRADDLLLDQLGRGEEPEDGGVVAATLSEWRATLPKADPVDDELLDAALAALAPPTRVNRMARGSAIASIVALLVGGAVTAAAEHAGPTSPLWPVTQFVFQDLAEARAAVAAAADSINAARDAIDARRYDDATRLLDDAASAVKQVDRREDADRLRAEIAALRALIPAGNENPAVEPDGTPPSSGGMRPTVPTDSPLPTVDADDPSRDATVGSPAPPAAPGAAGILPSLEPVATLPPVVGDLVPDGTIGLTR